MRILLAEDEASLRRVLVATLEQNHYMVDSVDNGQDALAYLRCGGYDGAILDIVMPRMDGLQVLSALRDENNSVPVMLLTARGEIEDRVVGLDMGANDYLPKPFDVRELLARLRVLTRAPAHQQDSRLHFGNIWLDTATFVLCGPLGEFRLSNKEYRILCLLLRNPGQVISVGCFLERVWGMESDARENTLWTYISYLRQKLRAIGAEVEICGKRNSGYVLERKK